jgi:hypothetical protein
MSTVDTLYAISTNPLVLLFVGAGISGILVPYFTRRWVDRQEELKLKRELISDLSNAVTKMLRAVESTEDKSKKLEKFKESREEWFLKIPDIGSQIHTYFYKSKKNIRGFWENYKHVIEQYCNLTEQDNSNKREATLREISQGLRNIEQIKQDKNGKSPYHGDSDLPSDKLLKLATQSDLGGLKRLITRSDIKSDSAYAKEWHEVHQKMFDLKHDLMKLIIETHMAGFSRSLYDIITRS